MRRICFRGKSIETNEWVYGSYVYQNGDYIHDGVEYHEINSKTLCQLTGSYDTNGKDIFEGDILRVEKMDNEIIYVKWDTEELAFKGYVKGKETPKWMLCGSRRCMTVIGNIYDELD